MAVPTRNGSATTGVATSTGLTLSHTVAAGSNRLLIANVLVRNDTAVNSVTYGGVAMTRGPELEHPTDTLRAVQFYLIAPAVGTANIVVSLAASTAHRVRAQAFDGVDQSTPLHANNTASGTSTVVTCDVTTSVADCVVVDGWIHESADAGNIGAGQTTINNSAEASWGSGASTEDAASAATVTMSWSGFNSDTWVQVVGAYVAAGGGGTPVVRMLGSLGAGK